VGRALPTCLRHLNVTKNTLWLPRERGFAAALPANKKSGKPHMKKIISLALAVCAMVLPIIGAESVTVEQIIALAKKDPKNAALVIEYAVEDNPRLMLEIVAAAVRELPEQAAAIVGALIKAVPVANLQSGPPTEQQKAKQTDVQREILRTAVQALPERATEITQSALNLFPAKAATFIDAVAAVVPAAQRAEITALASKVVVPDSAAPQPTVRQPTNTPFPPQPPRGDVISPSI